MVRFIQSLGLLLMAGGTGVVVYGGPYYTLDWGSSLVIAGTVAASTGLLLFGLGTLIGRLIREMAGLRRDLASAPAPAPAGLEQAASVLQEPAVVAAKPAAPPETAEIPASPPGPSPAPVAAVAAGAVAGGGLAVAARNILSSLEAKDAPSAQLPEPHMSEPALDADLPSSPADGQFDLLLDPPAEAAAPPPTSDLRTEASDLDEAVKPRPAASEEGIVAAYTVGDSSFAMYADGRIRATMPDGEKEFASMEELRAFMTERRLNP